jgi:hypothetical protein
MRLRRVPTGGAPVSVPPISGAVAAGFAHAVR